MPFLLSFDFFKKNIPFSEWIFRFGYGILALKAKEVEELNQKWTRRVALAATAVLLCLLAWGLWASGFFTAIRTPEGVRDYIERSSPYSHLVFFLLQLASVILAPIPSNITAAAGGVIFGTLPAFLLTAGAVTLGSALTFQLARLLGQSFVQSHVEKRYLEKYGEIIDRKRDSFLFLAFLFPFFPDDLLCIMAGLTDIPFRRFFLLTVLARPWGLLVACAVGGSALHIPLWGMALLGAAGVAVFLLVMKYGDRFEEMILQRLKK